MTDLELTLLLRRLLSLPHETEWVEITHNNADPEEIGEYLSALANAAALHEKERAYIVWGIADGTRQVEGTSFRPRQRKIGNEELENWLLRGLTPNLDARIHEFKFDGKSVVLIEAPPATHTPVRWKETEFIRVGSYKKKLKDYPEKERALWAVFDRHPFEDGIALNNASSDDVLSLIDYPKYFELMNQPLPDNRAGILARLTAERVIAPKGSQFDITNLGAILFAKEMKAFDRLSRKALRVVIYQGTNRVETIKEQSGTKGYAVGYEGAVEYIRDHLPQNEQIKESLRKEVRMYPEIAIRELVANAIIHQDFSLTGTGPMVEIFSDRIEFTNPGRPLIDPLRFIDEPPRSRNETLAALMRRMNICEERGSGVDKVIFNIELFQLPAPDFQVTDNHTKAILFAPRPLKEMDKADRIRACYQHACLCFVSNQKMTNSTLRKRFAIEEKNYAMASRIIAEAVDAGLIKSFDPESTSKKFANYLPFWA